MKDHEIEVKCRTTGKKVIVSKKHLASQQDLYVIGDAESAAIDEGLKGLSDVEAKLAESRKADLGKKVEIKEKVEKPTTEDKDKQADDAPLNKSDAPAKKPRRPAKK
ncbi:MAG: hypothetical protein P8J14_04870 [Emcibacteraceae bacterium]|nr:hypothetical protein [Emcibacteraceae bacterium]